MIDKQLLEIICCPLGKAMLVEMDELLICSKCGLIFPIKDGIPSLIIDEAKFPEGINHISDLKCMQEQNEK